MKFATITPTRPGERPEFLEFCKYQLSRMTVKPDDLYFMEFPTCDKIDLIERIRYGIKEAKKDGHDFVFIMEDDDYYPANYFELMAPTEKDDFIGNDRTVMYHLGNRTYDTAEHPERSSLMNTGFRISALKDFIWPENTPYLDMFIWGHALDKRYRFVDNKTVSMKHGIGKCGGKAHKKVFKNKDENLEWLKANVDSESFTFYKSMIK
jgi:hypothetical protein